MSDDSVVDIYDNDVSYTPPCCRPGGRCTQPPPERSEEEQRDMAELAALLQARIRGDA